MKLVLYHVGGGDDDIGPAQVLLEKFGSIVHLVLFDARPGSTEIAFEKRKTKYGTVSDLIIVGIDGTEGKKLFNVNRHPLSSSLLPISPLTASEDPDYPHCRTWADNAALEKQVEVQTTTIDQIVVSGKVPPPDFLSMDVQGAEYSILKGSLQSLERSILGLVIEAEFFEIYKDQGLFFDQAMFLQSYGFRLCDIYTQQYWFPGPRIGDGFLTVAEPLFLKFLQFEAREYYRGCEDGRKVEPERVLKLAVVSFAFNRQSFSYQCMRFLQAHHPSFFAQHRKTAALGPVYKSFDYVDRHLDQYLANNSAFKNRRLSKLMNAKLRDILNEYMSPSMLKVFKAVARWR
jgi:FkbM family methyltransferase